MLRKMMLAGLMGATLLSGIAPAYAQSNPEQRGNRGGERAEGRPTQPRAERGGEREWRGDRMNPSRGPSGGNEATQRWQQRAASQPGANQPGANQPSGGMAPPRPDPRWRGDPSLPANRAVEDAVRQQREQTQNWREQRRDTQQQRQDGRQDWRNDRRDDRQDWRNDRRGDQQGWRGDRRDDRQDSRADRRDDRQDWRADRQDDRRWNDSRGWTGNDRKNWNNGRRFDDRTRWANQRRWDNGWRQDRRYDWNSYRNRYGDRYRMGRYYAPRGWNYGYRSFSVGIFLNSLLYSNSYWLDDPYSYRLPPAYGSLRWIRYYDDALLVDVRDGYVVDVINNFFW